MSKLLHPLMVLTLVILTLVFWGSIASIMFMLCAILSVIMYFFRRFLIERENSDMMDNDNG